MFELVVRVVLSLGVVLGLFWAVARMGSRRLGGRDHALVKVRSRQSLSRGSSLAVVEVGSRVLVVGVSDGGVRLLTELDHVDLEPAPDTSARFVPTAFPVQISRPVRRAPAPASAAPAPAPAAAAAARIVLDQPTFDQPTFDQPTFQQPADETAYQGTYEAAFAAAYESYRPDTVDVPGHQAAGVDQLPESVARAAGGRRGRQARPTRSSHAGGVNGSLLDGAVWRDAWASATGRTHRRADGDAA